MKERGKGVAGAEPTKPNPRGEEFALTMITDVVIIEP